MKALICISPGEFAYQDLHQPDEQEDYAIIKIKKIGVCGTDLHAYEGTQPYFSYPRILGHELSGEIYSIGKGNGFEEGEHITILPYFNCGKCQSCLKGKTNCCTSLNVYGVHIDGGMREFVSVPVRFLVKSQGLSLESLALVEPLAIGAHSIIRAGIKPGETALVVGIGPIGLGIAEFAKIAGAKVILLDVNDFRLEFARKNSSADLVLNAKDKDVVTLIRERTYGNMPDVVLDATGSLNAINNNFTFMSHGGKYILVGLQKENISFSHPEFHKREGTLMSSRNATAKDFDFVISCIKNGSITPEKFITHQVMFGDVKSEFSSWLKPETGVIKAMISL